MKAIVAFLVLVIALAAVCGCTQPGTSPVQTTPVPTTLPTSEPTVPPTIVPVVTTTALPVTTVVPTPETTPQTQITTVTIKNNAFSPATLTVLPGTLITWINEDSGETRKVAATGKYHGLFTSDDLNYQETFEYTFGKTGTYEYVDVYHPVMRGTIIVKEGPEVVGVPMQN